MDKCFCHLNGYAVKDATARQKIEEIEPVVASTSEKINSIKPFMFSGCLHIIDGYETETLHTNTKIVNDINTFKQAGITQVALHVEIQPSNEDKAAYSNGTKSLDNISLRMFPSKEVVENYISLCEENNIKVYNIKFHSIWLRDTATDSVDVKMSKYRNAVNTALTELNRNFDYISICNEAPAFLSYSNITTFINELKTYGKVLLSGIGNQHITDALLNVVDGYCPHVYINASRLGKDTRLEFIKEQMRKSSHYKSLEDWSKRTSKPIIVGECGCTSRWDALWYAEVWNLEEPIDETGTPQYLYIKGLLNIFKDFNVVSINHWWDLKGIAINQVKEWEERTHE